jgi:hypothetical protein
MLQTSYFIACPHCLEQFEIVIDHSAGSRTYVEDCEVCCGPVLLDIRVDGGEVISVTAVRENE